MSKYAPHHKSSNKPRANASTVCQRCLGQGHYIFECKSTRPYISRPSRTEMLENPKSLAKLREAGKPSIEVPEEFKNKKGIANRILEAKEKERQSEKVEEVSRKPSKRPRRNSRSTSSSSDDSSSSDSDSEDESDSERDSGSSGSETDSSSASASSSGSSRSRDRKRRVPRRRRSPSPDGGSNRGSRESR